MHLSVRLMAPVSDIEICAAALAEGLALAPLSEYGVSGGVRDGEYRGFVLGYAGMPVDEVDRHVQTLARVIDEVIAQSSNPAMAAAAKSTVISTADGAVATLDGRVLQGVASSVESD
jgi:hypothetical protein